MHETQIVVIEFWKLLDPFLGQSICGFHLSSLCVISITQTVNLQFWFQVTYLDVTEPPDIIDERTPGELRVRENEALKLTCEARGNPAPRITWKREDGHDLHLTSRDEHKGQYSVDVCTQKWADRFVWLLFIICTAGWDQMEIWIHAVYKDVQCRRWEFPHVRLHIA